MCPTLKVYDLSTKFNGTVETLSSVFQILTWNNEGLHSGHANNDFVFSYIITKHLQINNNVITML